MPLQIPNSFATDAGNVPASQLDQNFAAVNTSLTTRDTIASATTTDLGTKSTNNIDITGSATVVGFGSSAVTNQPVYFLRFLGTITLTYNATSMILPGAASFTTAVGDTATAWYLGGGNWQIISYTRANGTAVVNSSQSVPPRGSFQRLEGGYLTTTTANFAADQIILQNSSNIGFLAVGINEILDTTVVGLGGLDTGTTAANTWYYPYFIYNGVSNGIIMSLSATAPTTLPSGYTYYARIGSIFLDGSKHIRGFVQFGKNIQHAVGFNLSGLPIASSGIQGDPSVPTWVAASLTSAIPPTSSELTVILGGILSGTVQAIAAPNNSYGAYNSTSNPPPLVIATSSANAINVLGTFVAEQTSSFFYSSNSADTFLAIQGYQDNL